MTCDTLCHLADLEQANGKLDAHLNVSVMPNRCLKLHVARQDVSWRTSSDGRPDATHENSRMASNRLEPRTCYKDTLSQILDCAYNEYLARRRRRRVVAVWPPNSCLKSVVSPGRQHIVLRVHGATNPSRREFERTVRSSQLEGVECTLARARTCVKALSMPILQLDDDSRRLRDVSIRRHEMSQPPDLRRTT